MEPKETESEETVVVSEDSQEMRTEIRLPFEVDKETFDLSVVVIVDGVQDDNDMPTAKVLDWDVLSFDETSNTSLISCTFETDFDKLYRMQQVPLLEVVVSHKDGFSTHHHAIHPQLGLSFFNKSKLFHTARVETPVFTQIWPVPLQFWDRSRSGQIWIEKKK